METKTIQTRLGSIKGAVTQNGTLSFKGIRYATAERFGYPKEVDPWDGVYDATAFGESSMQPRAFRDPSTYQGMEAFYYNEFQKGIDFSYSEDSLFLNIYRPLEQKKDEKLPVLFYIHGGAFLTGASNQKTFIDPVWPLKGFIGVTINYRLGPFGFLALPELKERDGHTGNYGLYDALEALKWVKKNIRDYGGDDENITIMGQSAGGALVADLSMSPLTEGLFHRAAILSIARRSMFDIRTEEECYDFWTTFQKETGCQTVEELKALDAKTLLRHFGETMRKTGGFKFPFCSPVRDGKILPYTLQPKQIPYLISYTSEDLFPDLKEGKDTWSEKVESPVYSVFFSRQLPGDDKGAWHSSDLWYWFGTIRNSWRPVENRDDELVEEMTDVLYGFVKDGNPNVLSSKDWKPYAESGETMNFGDKETKVL